MPWFDGGDNFVWIGEPFEGFGMGVVIVEEAAPETVAPNVREQSDRSAVARRLTPCCVDAPSRARREKVGGLKVRRGRIYR
jgi:hypothetical protein